MDNQLPPPGDLNRSPAYDCFCPMRYILLILMATILGGCNRQASEAPKTAMPHNAPAKIMRLAAEDARTALIKYLEGEPGSIKGPATLLRNTTVRDQLCKELRTGKMRETDGGYRIAGFHISLVGKWYTITLSGRGFMEDYRGEFQLEGKAWKARPPNLQAIGCFKDNKGGK